MPKYNPRMVVIGAPFDLCGARQGARLGPAALRLAGLRKALEGQSLTVEDLGDCSVELEPHTHEGGLKNFEPAHHAYRQTAEKVAKTIGEGRKPLVLAGDHSNSIGSVGGALRALNGDLAVLWIDAHADLNNPSTSPSGNLHGMPLACLLGLPSGVTGLADLQWRTLQDEFATPKLDSFRTAWLGLRDVDNGERKHLSQIPHEYASTMYDIDRRGMVAEVDRFHHWIQNCGTKNLWISFDVDCLDPVLAPGTGTAVRGGLSYREGHLLAEMLSELRAEGAFNLVGLDVVETNPIVDVRNETAIAASEWVASLFGKTILGVTV